MWPTDINLMASDFTSELKVLYTRLSSYCSDPEPIEDLKQVLSYIQGFPELESEEIKSTLVNTFPTLVSFLLGNKKYASAESMILASDIIDQIISLFPLLNTSPKYLEAFRSCTDNSSFLYDQCLQYQKGGSWGVPPNELPDLLADWRKSLSEEMSLDCVKVDLHYEKKIWARAKIAKINAIGELVICFENENSEVFRVLPKDSHEIAPYMTKTANEDWRDKLEKGALVDVCDTVGIWYHSTIQGSRDSVTDLGNNYHEVYVGYRIYEPDGEKSDLYGNYRGWSVKFDEWLPAGSPRIMPYDSCARKTLISQDKINEEKIVDDSNDYLETEDYAAFVTRSKKSDSFLLVRTLNRAKAAGIFETFIETLSKTDPYPPFDLIFSIINFVGKVSALFHKRYAKEYIAQFNSIAMQCLINSPQSNYRDFNKEKFDIVLFYLESLLKRVFSVERKNELIEDFSLEISLRSFQTPYLERKIQGLRGISDAISRVKFSKDGDQQSQELVKWIKTHNIIEEVFGAKGHFQLVQRCGEIVVLLSNSGELSREQLEFIWSSAQKQDEDMRLSVYKMLAEINSSIKPEHLEMLVEFIEEVPPAKLMRDDITLIQEITKYAIRAELAAKRACAFLWHAIIDKAGYSDSIIDLALETYIGLMKSWELKKNRIFVMIDCVQKIKENKSVALALQIIKNLIHSFPLSSSTTEPTCKSEAIEILANEHQFLEAFFTNLVHFKQTCIEFAKEVEGNISNLVVIDRIKYREEIEERLSLLQTLVTGGFEITLSRDQMDTLWETFLKQSLCSAERELYLKWLADATESQSQGKKIFEDSDIYSFFIEKVANTEDSYKDIQIEGFGVFKSYFILVNVSLKKMQQGAKQSVHSISSFYQNDGFTKEIEYEILVPPLELEGMKCLRKIMLECESDLVLVQASDLFHEIYDNVIYSKIEESITDLRKEFIQYCLDFIKIGEMGVQKRAMTILKNFMEECEKRGTGHLKPHNSILKGDYHTLTIVNHISYYPLPADIPKKIELKVNSNMTIWELRTIIGQKVKCLNDQFRILRGFSNKEIKDNENGKTINDMRMRLNENFTLYRRNSKVPRVTLVNQDLEVNPTALKIFEKWFFTFADKGDKMTHAGCAAFTSSCTGDTCQATDKSIQEVFVTYDNDHDGLLTKENFLEFYEKSCQFKPMTVWSNLSSHHYRGDLKRYDDGEDPCDETTLPGHIIMQHQENYDLLFESLNCKELADNAWGLLVKLPTNPRVYNRIREIQEGLDWNEVLELSSYYRLLYTLQIIQYFMQDSGEQLWKIQFIRTGGFSSLLKIFMTSDKTEGVYQKKCLEIVLKLVSGLVLAGFASLRPDVYAIVELVRKQSVEVSENAETNIEQEEQESSSKALNELSQEIINHKLENLLISSIDFSVLIGKLMEILTVILKTSESEVEDKHIAESALELWASCLFHNNSLIETVYSYNTGMDLETFTCTALTHPKLYYVRRIFCKSLTNVCQKVVFPEKMPIPYFLNLLMKHIPNGRPDLEKDYSQLFEIICKLIELDMASPSLDYAALMSKLMDTILEHPYVEKRTSFLSDRVLVGLLNMAEIVFRGNHEFKDLAFCKDFARKVFLEILFPPKADFSNMEYCTEYVQNTIHMLAPKAKCRDSRNAAYRLLTVLMSSHSDNFSSVMDLIAELQSEVPLVKSWSYSPVSDSRQNYVGIYNLGCICYMNSMLQQFFNIPQFRYSLLDVDDQKEPNIGTNEIDDNVIHQLQRMFGYLELTERQAYNPVGFCFSFKDFSGAPTNISIQQDAQEFLNMIFEKIENSLKPTKYKYLAQGIFGGKTVSQFICKVCGTAKENLEDFYNLSLDVKHSKTLAESLQKFTAGDTISDYMCEKCNIRVEITKRNLIETSPNILIVHLQRIVFNFDTFSNEKINTRLEFPSQVDLFPYTKKGIEDPEAVSTDFQYELIGVVAHKGTADLGHYYSFIKTEPNKWFEFNDSTVSSFNPNRIEVECFGGTNNDESNWVKTYKESSRNAYMLVYEKTVKHSLKLEVLEGDSTTSPRTEIREFDCLNRTMPASVYQAVLADNDKYLLQKNIYNADFFAFLLETINSAIALNVDISDTALHFTFEILCHSFHNKMLPDIINALKKLFFIFPSNIEKFVKAQLEDNLQTFTNLILVCTEKSTREAAGEFFAFCFVKQSEADFSENCDVKLFLSSLMALIPQDLGKHWTRFQQFWQFFRDFALGGEMQAVYLLNSGVIACFIDFYLAEKSPLLRPGEKRSSLGNKMWSPYFDPLVQTLAVVSQYCSTVSGVRGYSLLDLDKKCLFDSRFYEKTLSNSYDCKCLGMIIQHWSKEDLKYSEGIAKILLKTLNDRDITDIQGLFDVIALFLSIDDSYAMQRIEWVLGIPLICKLIISDLTLPYFAGACISCIDEELYSYPSTLETFNNWNSNEGIITLVWKYHKRWESFCLIYVKYLLKIFTLSDELVKYAKNLPPPTYQYISFMHWLDEFINKSRNAAYAGSKEDSCEEAYQAMLVFKEKYGFLQEETYVIGKTIEKNVRSEQVSDDIIVRLTEYKTEWFVSQPSGGLNAALPNKPLKSDQTIGYSIEIPYKTFTPSTIYDEDAEASTEKEVPEVVSNQDFTQARFEVINNSHSSVRISFNMSRQPNANFWSPQSSLTIEVPNQTSKDLIVLSKNIPNLPWPEIDYKWEIIFEESERAVEEIYDNSLQPYTDDVAVNVSDEDIRGSTEQVACPKCTSFNDSTAVKCEICDAVLKD